MTKLENVVDLGYDQGQVKEPFTMAFTYPKNGPVLIKGARNRVLEYMEEHLVGIYHYRLSHWRKGKRRGSWHIQATIPLSLKEIRDDEKRFYELQFNDLCGIVTVARFDDIPHSYITEFDLFQIGI